jgi:2-polyprenyl-3-methyl-5-hydroxy-6-metoxy-1,4-benzoquinol methylase
MPMPHASWAHLYDHAYKHSHGIHHRMLRDRTLAIVRTLGSPPSSIVDFAAGTIRLAVPLAKDGYAVTVVDPCRTTLGVLRSKADLAGVQIDVCAQGTQEFDGKGRDDIALRAFTTILHLLDESPLRHGLATLAASLAPGGRLLVDVPTRLVFRGFSNETSDCERRIAVVRTEGDFYTYGEHLRCRLA